MTKLLAADLVWGRNPQAPLRMVEHLLSRASDSWKVPQMGCLFPPWWPGTQRWPPWPTGSYGCASWRAHENKQQASPPP